MTMAALFIAQALNIDLSLQDQIVLLLGDTLHDFDGVFRKAATDVKRAEVDRNAAHFGAEWIVFPNATYGDWSTAPLTAWDAPLKTQ